MSTSDLRYPAASSGDNSAPPIVTPHYGNSLPNPPNDTDNGRQARCATGVRFITTVHGILNIVILVAIVCVIISAGVVSPQNAKLADDTNNGTYTTNAKVSAFHTRNAVLVFAIFGLILIIIDTVLHMTKLILRLPAIFDTVFIVIMLVLAVIFFILGCCAAAWEKKVRDILEPIGELQRKGAAASAAFFLFVAMLAMAANFILRLFTRRTSQSYNP